MTKITPCLWYDQQAEEAMNFYVSVFNGSPVPREPSRIISIKRYEEGMEAPGTQEMLGKVITGIFELDGQRFMALDGGPTFRFTEAISMVVECDNQEELDYFWEKLSSDPSSEQCGWLKDKFGLSWQITPKILDEFLSDPDRERANRVLNTLLKMKKLDIQTLKDAYNQA